MFTGIVEGMGSVVSLSKSTNLNIEIAVSVKEGSYKTGASVAIDGCCLTILYREGVKLGFEVGQETLKHTTLANLKQGAQVNIERALKYGDRFDGHLVTGHIDCMGVIRSSYLEKEMLNVHIAIPPVYMNNLVPKGSISVDGVSLTVNRVDHEGFSVALLPYTYNNTTLAKKAVGDLVNLEFDLIGKYILRNMQNYFELHQPPKISSESIIGSV